MHLKLQEKEHLLQPKLSTQQYRSYYVQIEHHVLYHFQSLIPLHKPNQFWLSEHRLNQESFTTQSRPCSMKSLRSEKKSKTCTSHVFSIASSPWLAPMCSPFLLKDFFQVALRMRNGRYSSDESHDDRLKPPI